MDLHSEAFRNRKMISLKIHGERGEADCNHWRGFKYFGLDRSADIKFILWASVRKAVILWHSSHWLRIEYIHSALDFRRNWMPAAGFPTNSIRDTLAFNTDHMNCIHIKFDITWYRVCQPTFTKTNSHSRQASNEGISNVILRQALVYLLTTKALVQSHVKQGGNSNTKKGSGAGFSCTISTFP